MKTCLIRLGPGCAPQQLDNVGPERDIYDRLELCTRSQVTEDGHLALLPTAPVLVDHDDDQAVGRIIRLHCFDDAQGRWWFARAEITQPPQWLRRGTRASICFSALSRGEAAGRGVVRHALVREVSILSPGVEPAEPYAEVCVLEDVPEPAPVAVPVPARLTAPTPRRRSRSREELIRRLDASGWTDVEAVVAAMKLERLVA